MSDNINLDDTRAVIVTGAGEKAFVAGADIAAMSTMTVKEGREFGKFGNDIFRKLETLPIPTIAAVNGFALGGGNELAMSCDIRYCSDNAVFGQPEVGLGITPGFGGTQRLVRVVGTGKAKEMVFTGQNIKADEAYRIGLVNGVYPREELMPAVMKLAQKIASNAPHRCEKQQAGGDGRVPLGSGPCHRHRGAVFLRVLRDRGPERGNEGFS